MLYHCNLICIFPEHRMHGCLRCLKTLLHSHLWKPIFLVLNRCETQISKNYQTSKYTFYRISLISPFAVKLFLLYWLVLIAERKTSVLATPVASSNLHNQAPLFTKLCLLQGTVFLEMNNLKPVFYKCISIHFVSSFCFVLTRLPVYICKWLQVHHTRRSSNKTLSLPLQQYHHGSRADTFMSAVQIGSAHFGDFHFGSNGCTS